MFVPRRITLQTNQFQSKREREIDLKRFLCGLLECNSTQCRQISTKDSRRENWGTPAPRGAVRGAAAVFGARRKAFGLLYSMRGG